MWPPDNTGVLQFGSIADALIPAGWFLKSEHQLQPGPASRTIPVCGTVAQIPDRLACAQEAPP